MDRRAPGGARDDGRGVAARRGDEVPDDRWRMTNDLPLFRLVHSRADMSVSLTVRP